MVWCMFRACLGRSFAIFGVLLGDAAMEPGVDLLIGYVSTTMKPVVQTTELGSALVSVMVFHALITLLTSLVLFLIVYSTFPIYFN
jgi:hypothetical protein